MAIRLSAVAAIAAAHIAALQPAAATNAPDIGTFRLANGLEVVVVPDRRTRLITHMVWYKAGSADDPAGKSGLAHLLEHLMFRGTRTYPAGQFSRTVAMLGGQENAFTNADYTAYYQRIGRVHLRTVMAFEADRMSNLQPSGEAVEVERRVVLEEYQTRIGNCPAARLGEELRARLHGGRSYGRPVLGWPSDVAALGLDDVMAFYRQFYAPDNAVVIIAGNVSADDARQAAEGTYGRIAPRNQLQARRRGAGAADLAEVAIADPRAQPSLRRSYLVPSYATAEPGVAEALEVLAHVLGGGPTGRFHHELVEDARLATWAGTSYEGAALGWSRFDVYAYTQPGVAFADADASLDRIIADVVANGVTSQELDHAQTGLIAGVLYARDSQATLARAYGVALTTGTDLSHVDGWPARIRAVTAEDVRGAARLWLDRSRAVSGYLSTAARP